MTLASVAPMHELTEEALIAASIDEVWRDLTDPAVLAEWIWPPRFETSAVIDPTPQGPWEVRSEIAEMAVIGRVLVAEPSRELRLKWRWEGEEHTTDVEITLDPVADDATRIIVHHTGFQTDEERESHIEGWSNCLERLVERHALT